MMIDDFETFGAKRIPSLGSGCGSVGRVVAYNTEVCGSNLDISKIYMNHLFTVDCIEKVKIKRKRGREWPM